MNTNTEPTVGDTSSNQLLTYEQAKQWFNETFCNEDGTFKNAAVVGMTVRSDQGIIVLPYMQIHGSFSLQKIFQDLLNFFKNGGQLQYLPDEPTNSQESKNVENDKEEWQKVTYRKKNYLVLFMEEDGSQAYAVIREEDEKILTDKHKTRDHVIALFKEQYQ